MGILIAGAAQAEDKPNIFVTLGDDIGAFNISAYNRGMMSYETPNIDRIAAEGMLFTDSCGDPELHRGPRRLHHRPVWQEPSRRSRRALSAALYSERRVPFDPSNLLSALTAARTSLLRHRAGAVRAALPPLNP